MGLDNGSYIRFGADCFRRGFVDLYTAEAESASVIGTPYFGAGETKDQAASTAAAATVSTAPEDAVSSSEGVDVSETSAITEATVSSAAPGRHQASSHQAANTGDPAPNHGAGEAYRADCRAAKDHL